MMAPRSPQFVQDEDELPLKVPGLHVEQLTASPSEYVPPSHAEQVVAPVGFGSAKQGGSARGYGSISPRW